eukprot:jgi/Ulvmu1/7476/UM037_0019.1
MAAICLKCCSLPCEALGHCCSGMEKGCSKGCSAMCGLKCCPQNHPSPIFLTYTLLFNVPIGVAALITAIRAFGEDCDGDTWVKPEVWNLVTCGLAAFFIAFSIRVYMVLSAPYDQGAVSNMEAGTSQQQPQSVAKSFRERVWYTACHEPLTFVYMFVFPFAAGWAIGGLAGFSDDELEGCDSISDTTSGISTALLVYLVCTCFVALISCCWEVKRLGEARYAGHTNQSGVPPGQLATHMFVPNFSGKPGYPVAEVQQPPQDQFMHAPDLMPVGTAVNTQPSQPPPPPGVVDQMQQAYRR